MSASPVRAIPRLTSTFARVLYIAERLSRDAWPSDSKDGSQLARAWHLSDGRIRALVAEARRRVEHRGRVDFEAAPFEQKMRDASTRRDPATGLTDVAGALDAAREVARIRGFI